MVGQNQFFLDYKVFINVALRKGAKKSSHFDHPLQCYGQIYVTPAACALQN